MGTHTLCFDIGGSGIKARVFDEKSLPRSERRKVPTPRRLDPPGAFAIFRELESRMAHYDRISAGFPGVVKAGRTWTATHLGDGWIGFNLQSALEREFGVPARVANDADVQGLAVIGGEGVEMMITLGTGFGSALFHQGILVPNVQLCHQPLLRDKTYEDLFGVRGLRRLGRHRWNRKLKKAIEVLELVFNWDQLYIGGGNSRKIEGKLPHHVRVVSNENGLRGGVKLWELPGVHMERNKTSFIRAVRQKVAA